jgi:hypothetical protein
MLVISNLRCAQHLKSNIIVRPSGEGPNFIVACSIYNLSMKEEEQRSSYQKQMLINRLYKSKNNPSNNKQLPKPDQETNLLFYVLVAPPSKPRRSPSRNSKTPRSCPSSAAADGPHSRRRAPSTPASSLPAEPAEATPSRKSRKVKTSRK